MSQGPSNPIASHSGAALRAPEPTALPFFVLLYTMMSLFAVVYATASLIRLQSLTFHSEGTLAILLGAFLGVCLMLAVVGALSCNWRPDVPEMLILAGGVLVLSFAGRLLGRNWLMVVPAVVAWAGYLLYLCWRLERLGLQLLVLVTLMVSLLFALGGVWSRWGLFAHGHEQVWPRPWPYPDQAVEVIRESLANAGLIARTQNRAGQLLINDSITLAAIGLAFFAGGVTLAWKRGARLQFGLRVILGFTVLVAWLLATYQVRGAVAAGYLALAFLAAKAWSLVRGALAETIGGAVSGALVAFAWTAFLTPVLLPPIKCTLWGALVGGVTGYLARYPWNRWLRQGGSWLGPVLHQAGSRALRGVMDGATWLRGKFTATD